MYPIPSTEKLIETKICRHCQASFPITDKDLEFYNKVSPTFGGKKYSIPTPTLCPDCRHQRRISFLNQLHLYKNVCLGCGKEIVSRFNTESGIKNYCNECWSRDTWDQLEQGVDPDFEVGFFSQVGRLVKSTPFQNLIGSASNVKNNAIYTNHTSEIHDSYFVFEANTIKDSFYCFGIKNSDSLVDCSCVGNSQYAYQCVDSYDMFASFYCSKSYGCKFSYFLSSCHSCSYCIGCTNLSNKSYHLFNKPISKEEYDSLVRDLRDETFLRDFMGKWEVFLRESIVKSSNIIGSEHCIGNNIVNSNNCVNSFDVLGCQDSKYSRNINYSQDLFDVSSYGEESNRMYDSVSVGRYSNNILFSSIVGKWEYLIYCIDVKKSKNCFLCVNLEWKEYCILNKQYTKEQYEELVPKIIARMIELWEWGEFFPASISPFGYNETIANDYYPLSREEALSRGFGWSDYESSFPKVEKVIPASKLPSEISDIPDDILNWAIECETTKKPFRIIKQELEFYRKYHLPIPRIHPDQRHLDRMARRDPRRLFECKCDHCGQEMITTFAPERSETVYCEECYDREVVG